MRAATDEALNDLVSTVEQIGTVIVQEAALTMLEDVTHQEAGYFLMLFLEVAQEAELELARRI